MDKLRYPIGHFVANPHLSVEERNHCIEQIPDISKSLKEVLENLDSEQLQIPYRPDGWTTQQVVHHMADNDMNAYLRLKRALTEDDPIASSYREDLFAELNDYRDVPVQTSLTLLEALHSRLFILLHSLSQVDFSRKFTTQALGPITIDIALQRFVWHNRHHIAQIRGLKEDNGW
ncbi:YfiT family bacillithiol transferase [Paenibacillus agricola]|uniref:Metal-dependent hydrolase n=1 Tax=Paenibacillus agricola TaxID=2716264 RepID=A0ABX0J4T7_9BACL|nr:putative metal-dependent hydrolase [Paenibacillus agricola]NHN30436.1 putative metal-dependent hydrolase [Paenibacillus agricola]